MTITVYSKPGCQQCKFTCRSLEAAGIPFALVDLTTNAALEYVQNLGYSQAPVVVVNDHHHWSGFNPDEIERLRQARTINRTACQLDTAGNSTQ